MKVFLLNPHQVNSYFEDLPQYLKIETLSNVLYVIFRKQNLHYSVLSQYSNGQRYIRKIYKGFPSTQITTNEWLKCI